MPATPIQNPEPGESLIGIDPQLLQQPNAGWRRRLNLFTGRTLSADALQNEQNYRSGLLATLGQAVTPGIVNGLVLSVDTSTPDSLLTVTPGYGIAASGEDVSLFRALQTRLSTLSVIDSITGVQITDPHTDLPANFQGYMAGTSVPPVGVLVLQPIAAEANGSMFDQGTGPLEVSTNLNASCDRDPQEYAFEDWQVVEGLRLVFVPWPAASAALPLPAAIPQATYRNRIAYAIFGAEAQLALDEQLPWMAVGVPVALVAFDMSAAGTGAWQAKTAYTAGQTIVDPDGYLQTATTTGTSGTAQPAVWNDTAGKATQDGTVIWTNGGVPWRLLFADRSAVVRSGGLPRRQPVLPVARIAQLSEQLSEQLALQPGFSDLASIAALLPPSAVLPAAAMDFQHMKNLWLPSTWDISAAPVRVEELEAALQTGMLAAPLDPASSEQVEVLVPLPDVLYDPNVLVSETVAPDFQNELDSATSQRNTALRSRKSIQIELNTLQIVLGPNAPQPNPNLLDLNAGLTPDEQTGRDGLPAFWPQPVMISNLDETFGTRGPATWQSLTSYAVGQFVIDSNGNYQKVTAKGTSGGTSPVWNPTPGQNTATDGSVTWLNAGAGTWIPNAPYAALAFVFDSNGNVQTVQTAGISGLSQYIWKPQTGANTPDGSVTWLNCGPKGWQANFLYATGQAVVDSNGNVQTVQNAGTSGPSQPAWGDALAEMTPDGAVEWINHGPPVPWARGIEYRNQYLIDSNGNVQSVAQPGTSGASQFIWNATAGGATDDGTVVWTNTGSGIWQANTAYAAGQFVVDANGNVQTVTTPGTSGATMPAWTQGSGATTQDGSVIWLGQVWTSLDLQTLQVAASQTPYTITWPAWQASATYAVGQIVTDSNGNLQVAVQATGAAGPTAPTWSTVAGTPTPDGAVSWSLIAGKRPPIPLIGADDWTDLADYGLQHFIDRLNQKVKKANDLIDLAFLTTQTDIYRFRQNVLGSIDASRLATSPILANIATGVTATATAQNLKDYFTTIQTGATTTAGAASTGGAAGMFDVAAVPSRTLEFNRAATPTFAESAQKSAVTSNVAASESAALAATGSTVLGGATQSRTLSSDVWRGAGSESFVPTTGAPVVSAEPSTQDVTGQSPIAGAQLDIRTLSIAERLAQPQSQESLFYAVGNRVGLTQALLGLDITIDDIQLLVDAAGAAPAANAPIPTETHSIIELRDPNLGAALLSKIQNPYVIANADEAGVFSSGVRVLEQHTQLLRALEARVQTYTNFVTLCTTSLSNVQNDVQSAQTELTQFENELAVSRQNLAFTSTLLLDEQQRVTNINAQRTQTLETSVQVVVYSRPRTLETEDDVPSRQLVPGNVANPVPTCLQQSVSVPPELSEIVALMRELPVAWFPAVQALMTSLQRPVLLQQVAIATRARAAMQLQLAQPASSALLKASVYGPAIAGVYQANQMVVRGFQTMRTTIAPEQLASLSWSAQVSAVSAVTTIADLTSSQAVAADVAGAVSRAQQQVSSVAGCVYARANSALPADRLAWAEFLRGPGLNIGLQNLAVLPMWTTQPYADRQQMQLLVDWLFAQIDTTSSGPLAFMSDVVRVCILLASHAPVNDVIAGAVTVRVQPFVGANVKLNLPSPRVGSGMYVQLFSKGNLAAEAVVNDLDSTSVSATVTNVHMPGVFLESNDVAHFTTQLPQAAAMRAFSA